MHLDKGYDNGVIVALAGEAGITDLISAEHRKPGQPAPTSPAATRGSHTLGLRWPVERTNSWFTNYGNYARNTDRFTHQRLAQIDLAVTCILTVKLIKWAKRWNPNPCSHRLHSAVEVAPRVPHCVLLLPPHHPATCQGSAEMQRTSRSPPTPSGHQLPPVVPLLPQS